MLGSYPAVRPSDLRLSGFGRCVHKDGQVRDIYMGDIRFCDLVVRYPCSIEAETLVDEDGAAY